MISVVICGMSQSGRGTYFPPTSAMAWLTCAPRFDPPLSIIPSTIAIEEHTTRSVQSALWWWWPYTYQHECMEVGTIDIVAMLPIGTFVHESWFPWSSACGRNISNDVAIEVWWGVVVSVDIQSTI